MSNIDHEEVAKFHDETVNWWDRNGPMKTLHQINPTRLSYLQKFTSIRDKTVLDIGCGGGIFSCAMAQAGANVTGIDANESAIAAAVTQTEKLGLACEFRVNLLEDLITSDPTQYDIITCMELLEHVPDPESIIAQASQLLKPGGLLCLSTINRTLKSYLFAIIGAEYVLGLIPKQTHDYDKLIKPSELENWVAKNGLTCADISGMSYNPFSGNSWINQDIDVNYFMMARRPKV